MVQPISVHYLGPKKRRILFEVTRQEFTCKTALSIALLTILINLVADDGTHQRTRPPLVRI